MALTSLAAINAALIPPIMASKQFNSNAANAPTVIRSTWTNAPNAGALDTTLNGVALSGAMAGGLPFPNPASGDTILARWMATCRDFDATGNGPQAFTAILCDRLWHNGGINATIATAQSITSPAFPARDENDSSNGDGVFLALENGAAAVGPPAGVATVSYTNSDGTAGRTATTMTTLTTHNTRAFPLNLQSGDRGVRSVQSIQLPAAYTSATLNLVAYRPLAMLSVITGQRAVLDVVNGGRVRIPNSAVLYLMFMTGNSVVDGSPGGMPSTFQMAQG